MVLARFEIRRDSTDLMEVRLSGPIDVSLVVACEREARAALSVAKPGRVRLLIDLAELTEYTIDAREALVDLQRHLAKKVSCTAYIADSAERRALALWVSYMTRQHSVRCFGERDQAVAWLHGFRGPVTAVRRLDLGPDDEIDEAAG